MYSIASSSSYAGLNSYMIYILLYKHKEKIVYTQYHQLSIIKCLTNLYFSLNTLCLFLVFSRALFSSPKVLQNFSDSPSHRIFRRMHEVLNIDENKN